MSVLGRRLSILSLAWLLAPGMAGSAALSHSEARSYVDPHASVVGDVMLGSRVFIAPGGSVRAMDGARVDIGDRSSVQDGAVVVGVADGGLPAGERASEINGVRIGRETTVAAQAQVHGPARIGDGVFIGMRALVYNSEVSDGCVVEPGAMVMGVRVPAGRYIPAGLIVLDQAAAEALPGIGRAYPFGSINRATVEASVRAADEGVRRGRGGNPAPRP